MKPTQEMFKNPLRCDIFRVDLRLTPPAPRHNVRPEGTGGSDAHASSYRRDVAHGSVTTVHNGSHAPPDHPPGAFC